MLSFKGNAVKSVAYTPLKSSARTAKKYIHMQICSAHEKHKETFKKWKERIVSPFHQEEYTYPSLDHDVSLTVYILNLFHIAQYVPWQSKASASQK